MRRYNLAAPLLFALGLVAIGGCGEVPMRFDPLSVDGRDGSAKPIDYDALMRIGAASHAGGDYATALGLYRKASESDPRLAAPFVAMGNTLLETGHVNEAIVAYNAARTRNGTDREALRGVARAYLMTGKPELAGEPLSIAYKETPDDPKLLQLIGVADDFAGQHEEAQARYRRGLELLPRDPGLTLNLALSLALTANYAEAVGVLRPIATAPTASARERQTLALIYGLQGDTRAAEQLARQDLDPESVRRNLAYYETLRRLAPDARARAVRSLSTRIDARRPS